MYFSAQFTVLDKYPFKAVHELPYMLILIFLFAYLFDYIPYLPKAVEIIADRTIIFLYLYIPISIISLASILIRSIF